MAVTGAEVLAGGGTRFSVWAPRARSVALRLGGEPDRPMRREGDEWSLTVEGAGAGARYWFVLDQARALPDPRSRCQPEGVHGPSQVVDPRAFRFRHEAPRRPLAEWVIEEIHVGAFTMEGTFAAAAARLPAVAEIGINAVEIMPVAAFPGARNWGYDGVSLYAPCAAYGTPDELRALVDEAHRLGLAVILDVVYNHLGPEGNYTNEFAPYFTCARKTPWGDAIAYERPEVRSWLVDNARHWRDEYRVDALRVDAVHAIEDPSPRQFLSELVEGARPLVMIAESEPNESRVVDEWGFDAVWSDDFHHALHASLTGERTGYYRSFGPLPRLARAIEVGWVRGAEAEHARTLSAERLVVCAQNHDQIGNRALGERLAHLAGLPSARLAAVATLAAAPSVPLLFMGEEFAAGAPFLYFTSHGDPALARAVTEGRRREFAEHGFAWPERVPDPQDEATFRRSKLDWQEAERAPHDGMRALYRELLRLRRELPTLGARAKALCRARVDGSLLRVARGPVQVVMNFDEHAAGAIEPGWRCLLLSEERQFGGTVDRPGNVLPPRAGGLYVPGR